MESIVELPASMPAGVLVGPRDLSVMDIPMWPVGSYGDPDIVLVQIKACGVCGSDFRYYLGENPWAQHTLGRFVPNPPNIVLGHEYAGVVVAVQSEANRRLLGKRVAPVCSKVCGRCPDCQAGRSRLCPDTVHMGHGQGWGDQDYFPGAYTRFAPSWGQSCFEIADSLSFEEAAMMDILAVCLHVAEQGRVQPGRPVLCVGAGPAGNGVAQAALALGASHAVLLDQSPVALDIATRQGVGVAVDTRGLSDADLLSTLSGLAPEGFGSVFDTVGKAETLDLGVRILGKAGTLVNLAVHDEPVPVNFLRLGSERSIVTSCNFEVGDYPRALAWLEQGRFRVKEWQTKTTLADLPRLFRENTGEGKKGVFKLVVDPWAS
ncbi:MAG: alcohol dehydrogenase catalytic domain-containing protein [Fimbriimonadaceae bacterium]|nr:alcohol dehydrogenase catalytic domain-containing protein [Fimbriimonadaceae bacterium]